MHRPRLWGLLLLLAACEARITGAPDEHGLIDAGPGDDAPVTVDAAPVLGPWSTPVKIPQASSTTSAEDDVTLSSNTLEMIFAIDSGTNAGKDLYYSSRASTAAPWSTAVKLSFNSATQSDETPRFSANDKTLYFASGRAGNGNLDIYSVTHASPDAMTWGTPQLLAAVSTTTLLEKWYMPCGNEYFMVQGTAANGTDLVVGTLGSTNKPTPIAELNSAQNETGTYLSQDCLTIYFASTRPSATSPSMIYKATRPSLTAAWQPPSPVIDFPIAGSNSGQEDPWMSADGRTFVFASDAAGTKDIYISTR